MHAQMDYLKQNVTLRGPNEDRIVHKGANLELGVRLISTLKVYKFLKIKCKGYLCNMIDLVTTYPLVDSILIVCQYQEFSP